MWSQVAKSQLEEAIKWKGHFTALSKQHLAVMPSVAATEARFEERDEEREEE